MTSESSNSNPAHQFKFDFFDKKETDNIWVTNDMPPTIPFISKHFEGNMVAIHQSKDEGKFKEPIELGFTFVDYLLHNNLIGVI